MNTDLERIARLAFAGEPDPVQDGRRIIFTAVMVAWIAFGAIALGLVLLLLGGKAEAHSFYEQWCCQSSDCSPIPASSIRTIEGGFQITLSPGDHPLVTRVHVFQIEQSKTRRSQDGAWHVCLWPTEDNLRCVYMPDMGF